MSHHITIMDKDNDHDEHRIELLQTNDSTECIVEQLLEEAIDAFHQCMIPFTSISDSTSTTTILIYPPTKGAKYHQGYLDHEPRIFPSNCHDDVDRQFIESHSTNQFMDNCLTTRTDIDLADFEVDARSPTFYQLVRILMVEMGWLSTGLLSQSDVRRVYVKTDMPNFQTNTCRVYYYLIYNREFAREKV